LYTHLVRHWLKKRSRLARCRRAASTSTPQTISSAKLLTNDSVASATTVPLSSTMKAETEDDDLDPRIQALMPQRYSVRHLSLPIRSSCVLLMCYI
jgi:hypothetical protein